MVQRDQWDTYWGPKRKFFNSRPRAPYGLWRPRRLNPVNPCPCRHPHFHYCSVACQEANWEKHWADCYYTRRKWRRKCVICAREVEYEDPPFPICECGTRVYCGEACQAQDWAAGHKLRCASRPDTSAEPFDSDALAAFLEGDLDDVDDI